MCASKVTGPTNSTNRSTALSGRASSLAVEPKIVHIPSDLITAYLPDTFGSLIGDKGNSVVFDNGKIKQFVPEYKCGVTWAEGLRRSIAWYEAHPQFQTVDKDMDGVFDKIIAAFEKAYPV